MYQCPKCKKWTVPYDNHRMCKKCYDKLSMEKKRITDSHKVLNDFMKVAINWCKKCDYTICDGCGFIEKIKQITDEIKGD
jgi:hypothetical protein